MLQFSRHTPPATLAELWRHPVLEALEHIRYGKLTVALPEGGKQEFTGDEPGPQAQFILYDLGVLDEVLARGEMGMAETYVEERWGSDNLPELLTLVLMNASLLEHFFHGNPWHAWMARLRYRLQAGTLWRSRQNVVAHYDLGNAFYSLWLDEGMTYSGALFEGDSTRTLEEAQAAKHRRILIRLNAQPGEHILDIGCGWGAFAEAAARQGLRVTGITLSQEQAEYAKERLRLAGLDSLAGIQVADYRDLSGSFDHIVSIGMFEHVGERYWPVYFRQVKAILRPQGRAVIQTITLKDELFETLHGQVGFVEQVIFPGGMLPSRSRFRAAAAQAGLVCHDFYVFGADYARTLQHWLSRFHAHREEIKALGYDETFLRLWRFYLASCLAAFASGRTDVMQAELRYAGGS